MFPRKARKFVDGGFRRGLAWTDSDTVTWAKANDQQYPPTEPATDTVCYWTRDGSHKTLLSPPPQAAAAAAAERDANDVFLDDERGTFEHRPRQRSDDLQSVELLLQPVRELFRPSGDVLQPPGVVDISWDQLEELQERKESMKSGGANPLGFQTSASILRSRLRSPTARHEKEEESESLQTKKKVLTLQEDVGAKPTHLAMPSLMTKGSMESRKMQLLAARSQMSFKRIKALLGVPDWRKDRSSVDNKRQRTRWITALSCLAGAMTACIQHELVLRGCEPQSLIINVLKIINSCVSFALIGKL